jgi:hypothetical protein
MPKSNSSGQSMPLSAKVGEWWSHLRMRLEGRGRLGQFAATFRSIDEYRLQLDRHDGVPLDHARILEIGFGARPNRMTVLRAMGVDIRGVDLDKPLLRGSIQEFLAIYRQNGLERLVKTATRSLLFDRGDRQAMKQALGDRGLSVRPVEPERFLVADATSEAFRTSIPARSLNLIFSEDVFEHVQLASLPGLVKSMAGWLTDDGLAFVRPDVFTGITGGHLPEWYPNSVENLKTKRSQPWEHLRADRFPVNTYLNRLHLRDYRDLFRKHFEILEEVVKFPNLGRCFLTPEVRDELASFSEDELFSNAVLFVLRPLSSGR